MLMSAGMTSMRIIAEVRHNRLRFLSPWIRVIRHDIAFYRIKEGVVTASQAIYVEICHIIKRYPPKNTVQRE